jgi:hypothetical protein
MRLARWNLTVLRLMWSSSAISALVRPWATGHGDFVLPVGQGDQWLSSICGGCGVGEAGEQAGGDARGDEGVALGGGVDGLDQQV